MSTVIPIVGIGADGLAGLSPTSREVLNRAHAIYGSPRQLALLDSLGCPMHRWPSPLLPSLPTLLDEIAANGSVIVASGDPMWHGIGSTVADLVGPDRITVYPAPSSMSLAAARLGWPIADLPVHNCLTRDPHVVLRTAHPGARCLVLCANARTPIEVASVLATRGWGRSEITMLWDLGSNTEGSYQCCAHDINAETAMFTTDAQSSPRTTPTPWSDLCIVAIEFEIDNPGGVLPLGPGPGLADELFDTDGQLTKAAPRALALADLRPMPGHMLWDIGGGTGTVGIEWLRCAPGAQAVAVERDPVRADRIRHNARRLGVPDLTVVTGQAPHVLDGRTDRPHAIFIGGGATYPEMLDRCWEALRPGGRLVVAAVTIETETLLAHWYSRHGGVLRRVAIETSSTLGSFTGWSPARTVTQLTCVKPLQNAGGCGQATTHREGDLE